MQLTIFTALAATASVALATTTASTTSASVIPNTWTAWSGAPTTTVTMTLFHANQTVTSTSYSQNVTSHTASATLTKPINTQTSSAAIATFSAGMAAGHEANIAVAAFAGLGAIAYGLF